MSKPPDERICNACGFTGPHKVGEPKEPHGPRITCGECDNFMGWQAKDSKKRRDRNSSHRYRWVEHYGDLVCHWCLTRQSETSAAFDIDHILPLEDGGLDEFKNTRPLCANCHGIRHILVRFQRHLRAAIRKAA